MNAKRLYVQRVTGVMNIKRIMKLECVIDVMPFIVETVMKWINVMIVEKWCVPLVVRYSVASFVEVDYAKNVPQHVEGE